MRRPVSLIPVLAATLALGCASPTRTVYRPTSAARAEAGAKAVGDMRALLVDEDFGVRFARPEPGASFAQSGEGTLGDRVFRIDEHGFLEGCRWVPRGRVCELARTPDGTPVAGSLTWLIPPGAPATPRAGGWLGAGGMVLPNIPSFTVLLLYYCRFSDQGPRCVPVVVESPGAAGSAILASFTVSGSEGEPPHDVLWISPVSLSTLGGPGSQVESFHRCEAVESSDEVRCRRATIK